MTSKERIMSVIAGIVPDRVPVSLYKIDPFDSESFWARHKSFENLLNTAKEYADTFHLCRPKTGFFFSNPESVQLHIEEFEDTPLSKTVSLSVKTGRGELTRSARTSNTSMHQWVQKPWVESEKDMKKFLSLPYVPFRPDFTDYYRLVNMMGDRGVVVLALPNPVAVVSELFAPGDMPEFMMSSPKLIQQLLDNIQERLVDVYRFVSMNIAGAIIRIRGAEHLTPPELPVEYFHDFKKVFCDFVLRYDRELIKILKGGNNKICYHWHGSIESLLPVVLKLGIDILEPVVNCFERPDCLGKIRKITGDNIVIMGGLLDELLEFRSPAEVKNMVKEAILQGGRNGRFILIPSNVPESSPISPEIEENYIQFIKTGVECGKYPLA